MTPKRHTSAAVELPNDLDILITGEFDAPTALVFDILTKPEHVTKWFPPRGSEMRECAIDLHVGGNYHFAFVAHDGIECSFRGSYLEVEPPTRTVETWVFEGQPHLDAVETVELHEADGVTQLKMRLSFRDKASRDEEIQGGFGVGDSFDQMDDLLRSLVEPKERALRNRGSSQTSMPRPRRWAIG